LALTPRHTLSLCRKYQYILLADLFFRTKRQRYFCANKIRMQAAVPPQTADDHRAHFQLQLAHAAGHTACGVGFDAVGTS
jgi:hypothetical protein